MHWKYVKRFKSRFHVNLSSCMYFLGIVQHEYNTSNPPHQSSKLPSTHFHFQFCELCNFSVRFQDFLPNTFTFTFMNWLELSFRVRDFLPHTFIYECKGWDVWGLPPLEYKGLAKVRHINIVNRYKESFLRGGSYLICSSHWYLIWL